jgi:hypothetical protein
VASSSAREEGLSEVIGHVDPRGRPIISMSILGEEDAFPVIVDTGFNGGLLLHDSEIIRHRCELTGLNVPIELADRASRMLMLARTRIIWFGQPHDVDDCSDSRVACCKNGRAHRPSRLGAACSAQIDRGFRDPPRRHCRKHITGAHE